MIGRAEGLKVKIFSGNIVDGDIEARLNEFFKNNQHFVIIDIKYIKETAIVIYKE